MKSRRVLQILVAMLSIVLLACILLTAALVTIADYITVMPKPLVEFADTFNAGMKAVSDRFYLYDIVVPLVAYSVPALLLLIATILLLVKKGKEAKNIVGCVFAFLGALVWALFMIVFAQQLFVDTMHLAVYCASGATLALFVLFVCLALFIRPKRTRVTVYAEEEQAEGSVEAETQEVSQNVATVEQEALTEEVEEQVVETPEEEEVEETENEEEEELANTDTPATQYVPNLGITIHDIVERTYGKDGEELSKTTLQKINKVRELYQAKAITEQEYIKLVSKYLGF